MKNLLNAEHRKEILNRIDKHNSGAKAQWGKMNVNQSLRHMAMSFDIPLGILDPTPSKIPSMPKWLLKFFLLNVPPPKGGAETFKEMKTVENNINPTDFEAERTALKNAINKMATAATLIPENKLTGKFTKDNWGKLQYNHTDHHLRQFGA